MAMTAMIARIRRVLRRRGIVATGAAACRVAWRRAFQNKNYVFMHSGNVNPLRPQIDFRIERYTAMSEIPEHALAAFVSDEGQGFIETATVELTRGAVLWIGYISDKPAARQWTVEGSRIPRWFVPIETDDLVIFNTVTLPEYRGLGISPAMMLHIISAKPAGRAKVYVDCKVWNRAAIRGIEKAGFTRIATLSSLGCKL